MYFACIRFDFLDDLLDFPQKQKLLFKSGNQQCYLSSLAESINKSKKHLVTFGGFESYEKAALLGEYLFYSLKLQFIKDGTRVKISTDLDVLDSTKLSTAYSEYVTSGNYRCNISTFKQFGANDYLGLQICEADSIDCIKVIGYPDIQVEHITKNNFTLKLLSINLDKINFQVSSCISFLNSSILLNDDIRLSFLLKIMAVEALTPNKQPEDEETISRIDKLLDTIHDADMKSRIGGFKNKSINKKCLDLISSYSHGDYNGTSAVEFWKECYKFRSSLVHDGVVDINAIRSNIIELNRLVCDLIKNYIAP